MEKNIIYLIITTVLLSSCSVLDVEVKDNYSEEVAWKNETNLDLYVLGLYSALKETNNAEIGGTELSDGYADILKYSLTSMSASYHNRVLLIENFITPDNGQLNTWGNYARIRRDNEFICDAPTKGAHLKPEFLSIRVAEARFMRAYLYYKIIRNHAGAILRTAEGGQVDNQDQKDKARSSEEDSWNYVIKEFQEIAELLPVSWDKDNTGRVTKGAAYGLMARCALYAKQYDKAIWAGQKVVELENQGIYGLQSDYATIFTQAFNKEILLAVYYKKPEVKHYFDRYFAPSGDIADRGGWAGPTEELVCQYQIKSGGKYVDFDWNNSEHAANPYVNREPRFYASVLYNGASWKGRTLETFVGGTDGYIDYSQGNNKATTVTGYYMKKFLNEKNTNFDIDGSDSFWVEMRYAEVLLIMAEAYAESGDMTQALAALNRVRERAGISPRNTSDKEEFMSFLRTERMVELAFEGHRYWDLRRWKLARGVLHGQRMHATKITKKADGTFSYKQVACDDANRYFPEKYYLIPVPNSEIRNNTKCVQNPLW